MINDNLLLLIKTLTPREKTVFKRHASLKSENRILNYVVLFDIYNKLLKKKILDGDWDIVFNNEMKKHPKIQKDIRNVKKRLKDKILESLVADQTSNNAIFQSALSLNILNILFERKLFSELQAKINQLKKQALQNEWHEILIKILDWECKLLMIGDEEKDETKQLQSLIDQQEYFWNLSRIEQKLKGIYRQMNLVLERDLKLKKKESQDAFEALGNHPFLNQIDIEKYRAEKKVRILLWFYKVQKLYNSYVGKFELCYTEGEKLVNLFETDEVIMKNFTEEYIATLCSFTRACSRNNKREELGQTLQKTKNIYSTTKNFKSLTATCDMGLQHYTKTMQYNKAKELIQIMTDEWERLKQKTNAARLLFYSYHNFILYWYLKDEKNMKKWSDTATEYSRTNRGKEMFFGLRLLLLTNDYDLENFHNFNEKIEALKKTLNNNEHLMPFEKIVLQYLRKLNNIQTGNKALNLNSQEKKELLKNTFIDFKNDLIDFKESQAKFIRPTAYYEILTWIESKIQQKSIREVFEESLRTKIV